MSGWERPVSRRWVCSAPPKDFSVAWPDCRAPTANCPPMNDAAPIEGKPSEAPSRASGSSFYTAMRILPRAQRDAMFEIYSFCRLVDDVADSTEPHAERRRKLSQWRRRIEAIYAGRPAPELRALAGAVRDFAL